MEQIDYKEKYEQALEVAQRFYNNSVAITKKGLEDIFPELAESEDERIRKHLIGVVELYYGNTDEQEKKDCLNWLEKQNLVIEMKTPEESLGVDSDTYSKIVDECIYGEQKPALDEEKSNQKQDVNIQINPSEYINDMGGNGCYLKKTTQASDWSEDDKKMSRFIGNAITTDEASTYLEDKGIEVIDAHVWLESLKDRVQPQPKQEWSEEDEKMWDTISDLLLDGYKMYDGKVSWNNIRDWLLPKIKSFRPQNTWKPTKRQLLELRCVISGCSFDTPVLVELEENLKKLIEE